MSVPVVPGFGWVGKRKLAPGLMTREAVMNERESSCKFIGYKVRIKLAVICNLSNQPT